MSDSARRRTNRERQARYRRAHPHTVRGRRLAWKRTPAGRASRRRADRRRHRRTTTPAERKARLLLVREHLARKRAALTRGGTLAPTVAETRAEIVRKLFVSASVAEALGDGDTAYEARRVAIAMRGRVPRPEGTVLVGAEQAEPLNSEDYALDEAVEGTQ